jgi:hypothetical protein
MSFDSSKYLQRATTRAKSDVANKLISMLLHAVSRSVCRSIGLSVADCDYADIVHNIFGDACGYCERSFERDRVAIEHPDAMNRFRVGLHIPGNVIVACKSCVGEKRRDDSMKTLVLAATGWESFLAHDGQFCAPNCKTCAYWRRLIPDDGVRSRVLLERRRRIKNFRNRFPESMRWSTTAAALLRPRLESIYKECQDFALLAIAACVRIFRRFSPASSDVVACCTAAIHRERSAFVNTSGTRDI